VMQATRASAPSLVYKFPGVNCISLNDEAVHGIPGERQCAMATSSSSMSHSKKMATWRMLPLQSRWVGQPQARV